MYVAEKIRREIADHENQISGQILCRLMSALEHHEEFPLHELYALSYANFQLAMELLQTWRLARHGGQPLPGADDRQAQAF